MMNTKSLNLIRDVIVNSGKWASIEIAQDSIYLEFRDVELGTPKHDETLSLTVRFALDSFFTVFYNNIWDIEFLSKYDFKNQLLSEEVFLEVKDLRFIDFEYLNTFFYNYKKEKSVNVFSLIFRSYYFGYKQIKPLPQQQLQIKFAIQSFRQKSEPVLEVV